MSWEYPKPPYTAGKCGWKAKYGGLELSEAKRLRELEDENGRLKRLVADLSLDREALKWVIEKNDWSSQLSAKR